MLTEGRANSPKGMSLARAMQHSDRRQIIAVGPTAIAKESLLLLTIWPNDRRTLCQGHPWERKRLGQSELLGSFPEGLSLLFCKKNKAERIEN